MGELTCLLSDMLKCPSPSTLPLRMAGGRLGTGVMRVAGTVLPPPPNCCSNVESRPCISPRQHSRACSGGMDVGEPVQKE